MVGIIILVVALVVAFGSLIGVYAYYAHKYKQTDYYKRKQRSYLSLLFDKGAFGEYRLVSRLEKIEGFKRILYNVYIPKTGEKTTEIDILYMNTSGLFVLESKNRGGRFYGNQNSKNWTQYIGNRKYTVYNPIKQNEGHIRWLKKYLDDPSVPCYSYIVFGKSSESDIGKVTYDEKQCKVMYTDNLVQNLKRDTERYGNILSEARVETIYKSLYPFSEVSRELKDKHVQDIKSYTDE